MITAYIAHNQQFFTKELNTRDQIPEHTVWLVYKPDEDEDSGYLVTSLKKFRKKKIEKS